MSEHSAEQEDALGQLRASLISFGDALAACLQVGLQPAEALRACGLEIPTWAGPMVNRSLATVVEEVPEQDLHS